MDAVGGASEASESCSGGCRGSGLAGCGVFSPGEPELLRDLRSENAKVGEALFVGSRRYTLGNIIIL